MNRLIRSKAFWSGLIILVILLVLVNLTAANRQDITVVERAIRTLYTPLQSGVSGVSDTFQNWRTHLADKNTLEQRLQEVSRQNQQLKLENQMLKEDQAELKRLRGIVNFKENSFIYDLIAARVIARSPNNWYSTVTIDKGSQDGIRKNMPVINPEGLVGRVSSVTDNSAQIFLITDREVAVGAILQEIRETNGIVEGLGDNNLLRMRNIPYYSTIRKGERVVTSGLSEYYPKGIAIGTIETVAREPNGLLLSASVKPAVNFNKLEEVLIISAYHPPAEDAAPAKEQN